MSPTYHEQNCTHLMLRSIAQTSVGKIQIRQSEIAVINIDGVVRVCVSLPVNRGPPVSFGRRRMRDCKD